MLAEINSFLEYLKEFKKASENTVISYKRDLLQLKEYLSGQRITEIRKVTNTSLNSYVLFLEKQGKAAATISRCIASMKTFFHYAFREGLVLEDPAEFIKAPKIEKKEPNILSVEEVERLLSQPSKRSAKEIRDKAMMELLYATGIRVTELINLNIDDVNLKLGYVCCSHDYKERMIPFGQAAKDALIDYIEHSRKTLIKDPEETHLFTNCNGKAMSRQGFWKLIKHYSKMAEISMEITPHTLRHSFAAHMIEGGADLRNVQEMLGHSDISTTQMYQNNRNLRLRHAYNNSHPR